MQPTEEPVPGITQIGLFRLVREVGRGGSGIVYLGERSEDFAQRVAIKVMHGNLSGDSAEDTVLRSLDHAGIVRPLDRGRLVDGAAYLVMEFVDGMPLTAFCTERSLTLRQRVELVMQAAEAVGYAHSRLVAHGDLKPSNMLVTSNGEVKLLDFGDAAFHADSEAARTASLEADAGQATHFTPGFSAPERRQGGKASVSGDIFSLGQVATTLFASASEPVPRPLQAIVRQATASSADRRYASVAQMRADLLAFLEARPVTAHRHDGLYVAALWARRNRLAASLFLVLLLLAFGSSAAVTFRTIQAVRGRRATQARLEELVGLTGTLEGELYGSLPRQPEADAARRTLLQHVAAALADLRPDAVDDPRLATALAEQFASLSRLEQAAGQSSAARQHAQIAAELAPGVRLRVAR